MAVSFFLRIFIYGLIGFVPKGNEAVVLVPGAQGHDPFIGFEATCFDPGSGGPVACPMITLPELTYPKEEPFPGYMLRGYQIEIEAVTRREAGKPPIRSGLRRDLPSDKNDAKLFAWVPTMASILGAKKAKVKPECLRKDPGECTALLAGRMQVKRGSFSTCRLVEHWNETEVHSFEFKVSRDGPVLWEQALAEVVELDLGSELEESVVLELVPFPGVAAEPVKIGLKPKECEAMPGKQCVDIFVGNLPPRQRGDRHEAGHHFALLYDLLAANVKDRPIPYRDEEVKKAEDIVQPGCGLVRPREKKPGNDPTPRRDGEIEFFLASPESRPVCPMVIYSP